MDTKTPGVRASAALACLFSALCCAGAYISIPIPIGPVPLALSNLFAVLGGLLLGPLWGSVSAATYLAIGALGFPVFSGGRGGLAHLAGPTAGYLAGYVLAPFIAGLASRKRDWAGSALGSALGFALILVLGAVGLRALAGLSWTKAFAAGVLPFLPGDAMKVVLATLICRRLGPFVDTLTGREKAGV
jgi:biotin transport system substrate-specific component